MKTTFIHTADWQLGKPFNGIEDDMKRSLLQHERIEVIKRIGQLAKENDASFVLVAGDLFDSSTATKAIVSAACSAIGSIEIPVYVIPGNHDHGGPGGIWTQDFYLKEQQQLAPNMTVLLKSEPIELDNAVLFPCPLMRRHESVDTTAWLRNLEIDLTKFGKKPLIVLAHGSIESFGSFSDDEETNDGAVNFIELEKLPVNTFDYVALGDWHGTKKVDSKSWYSGTPEPDRFPKGIDHKQGNVLLVKSESGKNPEVELLPTLKMNWHLDEFTFHADSDIENFQLQLNERIGKNSNLDLIKLELSGTLGLNAFSQMEEIIDSLKARLIRLKLSLAVTITPTQEEVLSLIQRPNDPLLAKVASELVKMTQLENEQAEIARIALRELFVASETN